MSLRGNLALVAVALILGGGVWWFEFRGAEQRAGKAAAARRILGIEAGSVRALEVPLAGGERARLVREPGGAWRLAAPLDFPADPAAVDAIVRALAELSSEAVIEDPPEDLSPFGLDERRGKVRIWVGEQEALELWLGADTPFGGSRYVAVDRAPPRIFTVARFRTQGLAPELDDLRDRRLGRFDPAEVSRVSLTSPAGLVFRAERTDLGSPQAWKIVAPLETAADDRRLRRLLQDLASARATGFVDAPAEGRGYGLAPPERRLEIETAAGVYELELGREGGRVFLRGSGVPALLEVEDRIFRAVPDDLFEYRDKQVLRLEDQRVRRLTLEFPRDGQRYAFVRDERSWSPERELSTPVDSLRVDDVVYALRDLEATGLEAASGPMELAGLGLDPPLVRVVLEAADGQELGWLELAGPEPSVGMAARSSQSGQIWRVRNDLADDVPMGLEAFENRFLEASIADDPGTPSSSPSDAGSAGP